MSLFATAKALDRVQDALAELRGEVSDLKRARRSLDLEFTELYDKVSHQMSRMSKRYAARAKVDQEFPEEIPESVDVIGSDPISQAIFLRRTGGGK